MFTLLLAITPDDIRRIGIPLGIIVGSILGGWAIARNRRAHMDSAAKGYEFGKSLRERHPWIKIVDPIVGAIIVLAAIYWFFIAKH